MEGIAGEFFVKLNDILKSGCEVRIKPVGEMTEFSMVSKRGKLLFRFTGCDNVRCNDNLRREDRVFASYLSDMIDENFGKVQGEI
jgi:hypothetical protein